MTDLYSVWVRKLLCTDKFPPGTDKLLPGTYELPLDTYSEDEMFTRRRSEV